MHITDSHNHLHFREYKDDFNEVMNKSFASGVDTMLLVGIDPEDSLDAQHKAQLFDGLYSSIGIHPQKADLYTYDDVQALAVLASNQKVIAVGETGFDLFRTPGSIARQEVLFLAHMDLAKDLGLPLIIHDRDAHIETIACLDEKSGWDSGGVFHCFSGDVALARKVLDHGFFISIPGVVTYKNASRLREVVRFCPLEMLLVETDAPYLSPVPYRGKRNDPSYIRQTLQEVARLKMVSLEEAARSTTYNFQKLFLKKAPGKGLPEQSDVKERDAKKIGS
ncbi:MAG TPA: TatD family deoxyribonuclease [Deltaproteobacteria bacterium]|nr:TatD family deoxyribonuclease [Deltaproteobacteria bacterium]